MCPRAVLDDGLLDITIIQHLSALQFLRSFPALYNGKLYEHPSVEFHRASSVDAVSNDQSLIEIDGEPAGMGLLAKVRREHSLFFLAPIVGGH